ncbi:MAG: hypothetical protein M3T55_08655 [Pseudomonadota bacterium]|nr:hypothetical protein [Pseudomonadota bacterium]
MKRTFLPVGLAAVLCATSALAAHDHFNRPNLGPRWVIPFGSLFINSNRLQGATGSLGYDTQSSSDTSVRATVYTTSTDLEYGAVASGNIAGGNNAFVKIQAQTGDGNFSNGAFYTGNNGGGDFFALTSEVPSPAVLSVSFCGTVATMTITSSAPTQIYNLDYGANTFGTGGGLGTYGSVALDNYKSKPGGCSTDRRGIWIKHGSSTVRDLSLSK